MDTRSQVTQLMDDYPLLQGFTGPEKRFVESIGTLKTFQAGEVMIREGERSPDLYLVKRGGGELLKMPESGDEPFAIGGFTAGDTLGELSFLDGSPRSASVRATERTEVLVIPRQALDRTSPLVTRVRMKLDHNLAVLGASRLKTTSREYVKSLQTEVELLQEQVHFGTLFVYMIIIFGLNWALRDLIQNSFSQYYYFGSPDFNFVIQRAVAWVGFIVLFLPVVFLIRKIGFPIREVLVWRRGLLACLREATLIAGLIWLAVVGVTSVPSLVPGLPTPLPSLSLSQIVAVIAPDYLFHSYIQELAARGIMQNAMQRFLKDENGARSVIVLSLAFGVMHAHLGFLMVVGSAIASVCFGFFYLRHRNLVGVTIMHYAVGVAGRYLTMLAAM